MTNRIAQLQLSLTADALIIEHPIDLLYLTHLPMSAGKLIVLRHEAKLLVDGRYFETARSQALCPVFLLSSDAIKQALGQAHTIAFDSATTSVEAFDQWQKQIPGAKWVKTPFPTQTMRSIKEPSEIEHLKKAARLTWDGHKHVISLLREGISEEELAFAFEMFCRQKGASRLSFESIIAFGENSALPHHRSSRRTLKQGDTVLIDVGAVVDGYAGDLTRVVFFGAPNPLIASDWELLKETQAKAVAMVKPGIRLGDIDAWVRETFRKHKVDDLFVHNLGHGIGLEVHEFPRIRYDGHNADTIAKPGMVFTIEPGLYRPGIGGVRYEDTVLVTQHGVENFSPHA
ncbi:MAG: aminopeptidase [Chlamydiota bacterium]|jgi:Xaa-Pro aminopeptidase